MPPSAALVQGVPGAGPDSDPDRFPLPAGTAARGLHELARLPAERIRLPLGWVVISLGGNVHRPPHVAVGGRLEVSGQVVLVPAGFDQDDRRARGETG